MHKPEDFGAAAAGIADDTAAIQAALNAGRVELASGRSYGKYDVAIFGTAGSSIAARLNKLIQATVAPALNQNNSVIDWT